MTKKIFVTGTDTNVGKTYVTCQLLKQYNAANLSTIACKPVASGGYDDAALLQAASSIKLSHEDINPFMFSLPTAPHLAARQDNIPLSAKLLTDKLHPILNMSADVCLIEGVGGWFVPLNDSETMADFVHLNHFSVLLVVGIRLGCINHALLTQYALLQTNISVLGWIANCIEPDMLFAQSVIDDLHNRLQIPFIGTLAHHANIIQTPSS